MASRKPTAQPYTAGMQASRPLAAERIVAPPGAGALAAVAEAVRPAGNLLVALILLVALALRVIGIRWGLPDATHFYSYHPDEINVLGPVAQIVTGGDWNPHFFNYPSLYIYLVALAAHVGQFLGLSPLQSLDSLHLLARTVTVAMGTATVYVVYRMGLAMGSRAAGLAGAALTAVAPLHVVNSHYATVDVPGTFWLAGAMWMAVLIARSPRARYYLLGGAALGFAGATKYNLALAAIALVVAHLYSRRHSTTPEAKLGLGVLTAAAAFFIGCPYAFLDYPAFREGFLFEVEHMRIGGTYAFLDTGNGWWYHLSRSLPWGLGPTLALLTVAAVLWALARRGRENVVLLAWVIPYFLLIGAAQERFIRYVVPLVPFLCLLAGAMLAGEARRAIIGDHARARRVGGVTIACFLFFAAITTLFTVAYLQLFTREDPRSQVPRWLHMDNPPGASVGLAELPWFYTPAITPYNGGVRSRSAYYQWAPSAPRPIFITGWSAQAIRDLRPDYYVVADVEYQDLLRIGREDVVEWWATLRSSYLQEYTFGDDPWVLWWRWPMAGAPPDWRYPCPQIEVYWRWKEAG